MLVLGRNVGERISIDGGITVTVVRVGRFRARLAISAPSGFPIFREEIPAAGDLSKEGCVALSRFKDQRIGIGDEVSILVVKIFPGRGVRLGIEAPPDIHVLREELRAA